MTKPFIHTEDMKPITWAEFKARELNRVFDEASKGKGSRSKILAETVRHGEREPHAAA